MLTFRGFDICSSNTFVVVLQILEVVLMFLNLTFVSLIFFVENLACDDIFLLCVPISYRQPVLFDQLERVSRSVNRPMMINR